MSTLAPILAGLVLLSPPGAAVRPADPTYWLVLRDGRRLAARGVLELRPPEVRFEALSGVLSSLPIAELDLEATRRERSTPRRARTLGLPGAEPPVGPPIGLAGEAAKRAGRRGSLIDLSGLRARPRAGEPASKPPPGAD